MSLKGKGLPSPGPVLKNSAAAPFIYFDNAPALGIANGGGALEIELAARTLMPGADGQSIRAEFVNVAHLRCTPAGAMALIDALTKAMDMLKPHMAHPDDGRAPLHS